MKRISSLLILMLALVTCHGVQAQSRTGVSILGDSYSTYKGHMTSPENAVWYDGVAKKDRTDVERVDQTWWHQLIKNQGYRLVTNNSYSGATICNTGYRDNDYTDRSFLTRLPNLGSPDKIYVFGGTNDDWSHAPMGEFKYSDWKRADLYHVRPAMAAMVQGLQDYYPGADIVLIINSGLRKDVTDALKTVAKHYGVEYIQLQDIDKMSNHPTVKGMKQIADQIAAWENARTK